MPTDIWWNVFYDVWNDYQLLQPAFEPGGIKPANNECVDDCLHLAKIGFMLRLYGLWNTHQYNIWKYKYNQKLQYLSNKIKEKANKKGVWLYYLHRAFIYTQMHQYDKAKTDIYDGCIQCGSTNDTVYALYSILLCVDGINQHTAIKVLQQGAGKCPGSNIINQLLDKLETEQTLTISDIQYLQLIENTDDNEEKIEFYSQNNLYENDSDNIESLMINVGSMIKNRDGIPIIYFVLRVLYNIIQFPSNNKVRQLDINQVRMRTNPYGQVTINLLSENCDPKDFTHTATPKVRISEEGFKSNNSLNEFTKSSENDLLLYYYFDISTALQMNYKQIIGIVNYDLHVKVINGNNDDGKEKEAPIPCVGNLSSNLKVSNYYNDLQRVICLILYYYFDISTAQCKEKRLNVSYYNLYIKIQLKNKILYEIIASHNYYKLKEFLTVKSRFVIKIPLTPVLAKLNDVEDAGLYTYNKYQKHSIQGNIVADNECDLWLDKIIDNVLKEYKTKSIRAKKK
eukprot:123241_1